MKKLVNKLLLLCFMVIAAVGMKPATVHATGEENPRVIVEEYSISEDEIIPGQEFELTLKLRNTSQFYDIYNVVVSLNDTSDTIYPVYGTSNQCYIDRIYARNNTQVTLKFKAAEDVKLSVIPLIVRVTYNDNYFIEKQLNEAELFLPVRLAGDLNVVSSSVPSDVSVGAKARVSVTYENTGSQNLYNIMLNVTTYDGEMKETSTNLYNLSGGTKKTAEVYLDCNNVGNIPISFYFVYEDENGEKYETSTVSKNIKVVEATNANDKESVTIVGGGVSVLTFVLLAAIVVVAIGILGVIKKRRR